MRSVRRVTTSLVRYLLICIQIIDRSHMGLVIDYCDCLRHNPKGLCVIVWDFLLLCSLYDISIINHFHFRVLKFISIIVLLLLIRGFYLISKSSFLIIVVLYPFGIRNNLLFDKELLEIETVSDFYYLILFSNA